VPAYVWTAPDGSTATYSGTLLTSAGGAPLLFLVGENLTIAQLVAAGSFELSTGPAATSVAADPQGPSASATAAPLPDIAFGTLGDDNLVSRDRALAFDKLGFGLGGDDAIIGGTSNDWMGVRSRRCWCPLER
jgi:hypothetical protein